MAGERKLSDVNIAQHELAEVSAPNKVITLFGKVIQGRSRRRLAARTWGTSTPRSVRLTISVNSTQDR
ncbi:hypothetical protein SAMN02799620_06193 [Mycolicibacterium fluoranthenivorans]|uniref:Uncharacterized protein n=1 Tax=Mycolicibacterium fluoranthenivorans TaxID=258505 RepID=A0A1G4X1S9_9MYCO|nr:hypothetical protein SAMN02799620_06193 [Mycolicibacterium fluoranthenivorans]